MSFVVQLLCHTYYTAVTANCQFKCLFISLWFYFVFLHRSRIFTTQSVSGSFQMNSELQHAYSPSKWHKIRFSVAAVATMNPLRELMLIFWRWNSSQCVSMSSVAFRQFIVLPTDCIIVDGIIINTLHRRRRCIHWRSLFYGSSLYTLFFFFVSSAFAENHSLNYRYVFLHAVLRKKDEMGMECVRIVNGCDVCVCVYVWVAWPWCFGS